MSSRARLLAQQRRRLERTLRWASALPGYRDAFSRLPSGLDVLETLERLPILERSQLQAAPDGFRDPRRPSIEIHTSGSTATPLAYHLDQRARRLRLLRYARFHGLHGWRPWHRSLTFKVLPDSSERVGSGWLDRTFLARRRVMSVLDPPQAHLEALRRDDPVILHGLPSTLVQLLSELNRGTWRPRSLRVIFSSSEALEPEVRSALEEGFGAPVVDHYGAAEGLIGWECEQRRGYHQSTGSVFLEILKDGGKAALPGEEGAVVITTLDNPAMPLVRYAIGDTAVQGDDRACPCGRPEPLFPEVIGRGVELFQLPSGPASPWGAMARMREVPGLMRFQIIQTAPAAIEVRVLSRDTGRPVDPSRVAEIVRATFEDPVAVVVRETKELLRLPSGKFAPALRLANAA